MNQYKIKIELLSPLGTRLMADTIWGHICYGILFNEGEEKLNEFLQNYKDSNPSLVLSTPFPEGKIPLPKILHQKSNDTSSQIEMNLEEYRKLKRKKKIKYLNYESLVNKNSIDLDSLIEKEIEEEDKKYDCCKIESVNESRFHNVIDRMKGTTSSDSLFQTEEYWCLKVKEKNNIKKYDFPIFEIYVLSIYNKDYTLNLFKNGIENGYGADSSVGKGIIKVKSIEDIDIPKEGNIAMALAPFVLFEDEYNQLDENYGLLADIWTKYPKVHNSLKDMTNPFKKPIVFYKEGATIKFKDKNDEKPLYLGKCLQNIHHLPYVMQYSITPLLWLNLKIKESQL